MEKRLSCEEAARIAEALIDGEVDRERERLLRAHMASCGACNEAYAFDLALVRGMRDIPEAAFVSVSGAVMDRLAARRRRVTAVRWAIVLAAVTGAFVILNAFGSALFRRRGGDVHPLFVRRFIQKRLSVFTGNIGYICHKVPPG